jgi:hypothetical protein
VTYRINWARVWIAFCGFLHVNFYFGWNAFPQSQAEMIADLFVLLIGALATERRA